MLFTQENLIIPLTSGMVSCTANVELDSFNMRGYDHATIILQFNSALGTAVSAPTLTLECASSDSGDAADATFHYRINGASTIGASADVLAADATASTLALTGTTYAGHMLILEIDANELPTASKTYEWVTVDLGANSSVGAVEGYAILSNPRYADAVMNTAI